MPQAQSSSPSASLPAGIEIFRQGRHTDDAGVVRDFTAADLQRMAQAYDPSQREAPLTVGHPAHNLPAYGFVQRLVVNDAGRLAMDPHQVEPQFAEMVQAGRFKKRSAAFYSPQHPNNPKPGAWYLRHVAFLGAQPPAVSGLKDIEFSEGDGEGLVYFSETSTTQEPDPMDKELQAQLDAANVAKKKAEDDAAAARLEAANAKKEVAAFAEAQRQERHTAFVSFAESQVKAGKVLPKDQTMLVRVLDDLATLQPVEFAEGDATRKVAPAQWLQDLIANVKPVVAFGEFAPGGAGAAVGGEGGAKGKTDAEIDAAAKVYARQKSVSYAEALNAVTSFTS